MHDLVSQIPVAQQWSVHPGYIWTPMVENYLKSQGEVAQGRKLLDNLHPIGHVGEPDDIAYGVLYLASARRSSSPERSW